MYEDVSHHQVDEILKINKGLVKPIYWEEKNGNYTPQILTYYSAMDMDNQSILEGVLIRCKWMPSPIPDIKAKYDFAIFLGQHRVYALDFHWLSGHKNKIGRGLPFYNENLRGPHRHLWAESSYGYAEPLEPPILELNMEDHWKLFCDEANIIRNNDFSSPEYDFKSGQGRLL